MNAVTRTDSQLLPIASLRKDQPTSDQDQTISRLSHAILMLKSQPGCMSRDREMQLIKQGVPPRIFEEVRESQGRLLGGLPEGVAASLVEGLFGLAFNLIDRIIGEVNYHRGNKIAREIFNHNLISRIGQELREKGLQDHYAFISYAIGGEKQPTFIDELHFVWSRQVNVNGTVFMTKFVKVRTGCIVKNGDGGIINLACTHWLREGPQRTIEEDICIEIPDGFYLPVTRTVSLGFEYHIENRFDDLVPQARPPELRSLIG